MTVNVKLCDIDINTQRVFTFSDKLVPGRMLYADDDGMRPPVWDQKSSARREPQSPCLSVATL